LLFTCLTKAEIIFEVFSENVHELFNCSKVFTSLL